jgi:hypothetical protein
MYLQVFRMKRKGAVESRAGWADGISEWDYGKWRSRLNNANIKAANTTQRFGGDIMKLPKSPRVHKG